MTERKRNSKPKWIDPDDAPELTWEAAERAQIAVGGKVIREATGTLTRRFTEEELEGRMTREVTK
jgi:hypothetical protein